MGVESLISYYQVPFLIHSAVANNESFQVFKCRTTQHKEIKSNLTRDLGSEGTKP